MAIKKIVLAGGCFYGVEGYMAALPGVVDTQVGYANGHTEDPKYEQVKKGDTGFAESCEVFYDPDAISLRTLLRHFLRTIDPTTLNRQGHDVGTQYRSAIFYGDESEKELALELLAKEQKKWKDPIVLAVEPFVNFYDAEEYHQDYLKKDPCGHCHIDMGLLDVPLGPEEQ